MKLYVQNNTVLAMSSVETSARRMSEHGFGRCSIVTRARCAISDKKFDIDQETKGLLIRNVSRQDEGKYRCKATHVNNKESDLRETDIELLVQCEYPPEGK